MSSLANVLDNPDTGGKTYYDADNDKPRVRMAEGNYPVNVINVETVKRRVKGKYEALIYNLTFRVADADTSELDAVDFDGNSCKVKTSHFAGREYRGQGIFKFLEPNGTDDFEANPSGNKGYANLCQVLEMEGSPATIKIDGKDVTVKELPDLKEDDILGKPVMASIKKGKPWTSDRDGITRFPYEVKWLSKWDGPSIDLDKEVLNSKDDIPF